MTELQSLFVILVVVYVTQCVSWVAPHAVVFSRNYRGRWREGAPDLELSAWKTTGALANLLPFFSGVVVASPEPLALTPEAVFPTPQSDPAPGASTAETPRHIPFSAIKKIAAQGERVTCNGREIHRATSAAEARHVAAHLRSLAKLKQTARAAAIEKELKRQFDTEAIRARLEEYCKATRWVGRLSNLLFVVLFMIVPAYIWFGVITLAWLALLAVTVLIIAALARSFSRAHRQLHPDDSESRWTDSLTVALSPFAAIRSRDALARNLLATFDPLVIASVLLPAAAFEQAAARATRHLHFPVSSSSESASEEWRVPQAWFQRARNGAIENFLKENCGDLQKFLKPPAPNSKESRSYCPRCHSQFRVDSGECNDCRGVLLVGFSSAGSN